MNVQVAPCSFEAAKYAVLNWHYSEAMPSGKLIKFGVWEDGKFIGSILYGRGATPNLGKPYGLDQTELCELVRVALTNHTTPVSQLIALTLNKIKETNPGIRLVVSFADPKQGHVGGIYQAGNWIYSGTSNDANYFKVKGKVTHPKTIAAHGIQSIEWVRKYMDPNAELVPMPGKHRYLYPLDKQIRRRVLQLSLPYPKLITREGSVEGNASGFLSEDVGSTPAPRSKAE